MEKQFAVYIMASGRNGTLYIGVTSNLPKRAWEHRESVVGGFTSRYEVKSRNRAWKLRLIEERNPDWQDLYSQIC